MRTAVLCQTVMETNQQCMLHLRMQKDCLSHCDKLKIAIHDWLGFPENQVRPNKLAALEPITADPDAGEWEEEHAMMDKEIEKKFNELNLSGYPVALVKN